MATKSDLTAGKESAPYNNSNAAMDDVRKGRKKRVPEEEIIKKGKRVRAFRERLGVKRSDFAQIIGLSESTIESVEQCRRNLTDQNAKIIAEKYNDYSEGIRVEYLLLLDDYETEQDKQEALKASLESDLQELEDDVQKNAAYRALTLYLEEFAYSAPRYDNDGFFHPGLTFKIDEYQFRALAEDISDYVEMKLNKLKSQSKPGEQKHHGYVSYNNVQKKQKGRL